MPPPLPEGYLSPHFSLAELTTSQVAVRRGIPNVPGAYQLANLQRLAVMLEEVRLWLGGAPLLISSGYRCEAVNKLVGGSGHSAHVYGRAVDFTAPSFGSPLDVCRKIQASTLLATCDQLIYEGSWVHLAIAPIDQAPAALVLTATFRHGQPTTYTPGLP